MVHQAMGEATGGAPPHLGRKAACGGRATGPAPATQPTKPEVGDREVVVLFLSSRRRHTRLSGDWSSDVCSSDLDPPDSRISSLGEIPTLSKLLGFS